MTSSREVCERVSFGFSITEDANFNFQPDPVLGESFSKL